MTGFWRTAPLRSADLETVRQYGINCISTSDGRGAMSAGWYLWQAAGLHESQAYDLITDGYRQWVSAERPDLGLRIAFLIEMFEDLIASIPVPPAHARGPSAREVKSLPVLYGACCWTGTELVECLIQSSDPRAVLYEQRVFELILTMPPAFVPPRSMRAAREYASVRGIPDPFTAG